MVSTRRQLKLAISKGKLTTKKTTPRPLRTTARKKSRGDAIQASALDDVESDQGEEDSHWKEATDRRVKRTKVSHKKSTRKKKVGIDCTSVLSLPFDIQLEIFSWLHSKDLISLSHTSRDFCQALMHRSAARVWKLAREAEGVPEPPPTLSETQWAALLFDGTSCSECGASRIQNIDFGILRRACVACRRANLVGTLKFEKEYPEYDEILLEMIPYTNYGGWSDGWSSSGKFYWLEDIYDISKQWATYQDAIYRRVPGARQKAEEFHPARKELVKGISEVVKPCRDWQRGLQQARANATRNQYKMRRDEIYTRFSDMGYSQTDLDALNYSEEVSQPRPLTDRIWKRIRPIIEAQIKEHRQDLVVRARKFSFRKIFEAYVRSLPPREWLHHPSITDVLELSIFEPLLNAQWGVDVTAEDFQAVLPSLPGAIEAMQEAKKQELVERVLAHHSKIRGNDDISSKKRKGKRRLPPKHATHPPVTVSDPLNLATSVFVCSHCQGCHNKYERFFAPVWFGWEGVLRHSCYDLCILVYQPNSALGPRRMGISERGVAIAAELVKEVGLDPETATIRDMDQVGARWFCTSCSSQNSLIYDWRAVVADALSSTHVKIPPVRERLTDYQLSKVIPMPPPQYPFIFSHWGCAHCDENFRHWASRGEVEQHLYKAHNIYAPVESEDMVRFFQRRTFEVLTERCPIPPHWQPAGS